MLAIHCTPPHTGADDQPNLSHAAVNSQLCSDEPRHFGHQVRKPSSQGARLDEKWTCKKKKLPTVNSQQKQKNHRSGAESRSLGFQFRRVLTFLCFTKMKLFLVHTDRLHRLLDRLLHENLFLVASTRCHFQSSETNAVLGRPWQTLQKF